MDDPLAPVGHGGRVLAEGRAFAERLDAVELDRIIDEAGENAHRVTATANAGGDDIRQVAGHFNDLLTRFDANDLLEITDHHRERMRANH